ncbi:hypothetical protein ACFQJ7_05890 [Halovenus rubra]|uniref:Uncharacterized protein n=2 Tax=Halovenus rubra TaxID=869890 RepID=A0ABD5X3A2_9EURY|nr:hypothetical protein [Halovenus rubra]
MSRATTDFDPSELPPPICRYCGYEIREQDQTCTALEDGVCSP